MNKLFDIIEKNNRLISKLNNVHVYIFSHYAIIHNKLRKFP